MKKILSIIFMVAFVSALVWALFSFQFISWDFRNNLWAPTRLIWLGESAYNISILVSGSNAIWLPQAIGLFSPLGLLPQYIATNLWLCLNIVLLLTTIGFLFHLATSKKPSLLQFGILACGAFILPSTLRHLMLGQIDIVLILFLILGIYAAEKGIFFLSGLCFAIALTKPQLCIIVLPCVIANIGFIKKQYWNLTRLVLAIVIFSVTLTIPLWVSNSAWLSDFLTNIQSNPNWIQPNIYYLLHSQIGYAGIMLWFILYILILAISFQIWRKRGYHQAMIWGLALTAIISPYIWSWDFVLLIPLCIDTFTRFRHRSTQWIFTGLYLACVGLSIFSLISTSGLDDSLWYVPYWIITGVLASIKVDQMPWGNRIRMDSL